MAMAKPRRRRVEAAGRETLFPGVGGRGGDPCLPFCGIACAFLFGCFLFDFLSWSGGHPPGFIPDCTRRSEPSQARATLGSGSTCIGKGHRADTTRPDPISARRLAGAAKLEWPSRHV